MGQIYKFPEQLALRSVSLASRRRHDVWVRVVDRHTPEATRWELQFAMQRAASFSCLEGFGDEAARRREWHNFEVSCTRLSKRFLADTGRLISEGRVQIEIDGNRVRPAFTRVA